MTDATDHHEETNGTTPDQITICGKKNKYELDDATQSDRLQEDNVGWQGANLKPLDGGYGWFVVLGCVILHIIHGGLDRSEGVFFLILTERFDESAQLTAWPGAMTSTLQLLLGPVANALATRYSVRTAVIIGGVLMSLGLFLNSYAINFYMYFVTHALIGGIGKGIAYAPGLTILNVYFDKRLSLAAGIGTSGVGLGTFVIVPLTQYLSDTYGFSGTFLIISGLSCNLFVAAMLYRPLSMHYKFMRSRRNHDNQRMKNEAERQDTDESLSPIFQSQQNSLQDKGVNTAHTSHKGPCNCLGSSLKICFPTENNNRNSTSTRKLLNLKLLKIPAFLFCCLSMGLFAMSFRTAFMFIPALIESKGISKSDAAMALSVAGAVDTVGRIVSGLILDRPTIRPFRLMFYNAFIFGVASIAFVLPSLNSTTAFSFMCGLFGLMTGAFISQKSVVLVDILDPEYLASSFGIYLCFQGIGNLVGPPLAGGFKDLFGTFSGAFYLGGGLLVVSGLLMVVSNILNRAQKRRNMPVRENVDTTEQETAQDSS